MPPDTICEETQDLLTCDELLPTVCERTEGDYLAYISGAVVSPDDLYTTTCQEQSLEGLQRERFLPFIDLKISSIICKSFSLSSDRFIIFTIPISLFL